MATRLLQLGPLSIGATGKVLRDRLGIAVSRRELRRLHRASQGIPLLALELGRALRDGEPVELDVHGPAADGFAERVDRLEPAAARLVAAVALSPGAPAAVLESWIGADAIEQGVAAGVVAMDAGRLQPAHPLLGAAALGRLTLAHRRALHAELAALLSGEERARQLALATEQPDADIAAELVAAAGAAAARGAPLDAAELAEHALRVTPAGTPERQARLLALASYLNLTGDSERVAALLGPALEWLPAGSPGVQALLLLAADDADKDVLDAALIAAGEDRELRAIVLARRAEGTLLTTLCDLGACCDQAAAALAAAPRLGELGHRVAEAAAGWADLLSGRPLVHPAAQLDSLRQMFRGEINTARDTLDRAIKRADARGEARTHALLLAHRCELELRAANWTAAQELLDECERWPEGLSGAASSRLRALLAAGRGDTEALAQYAQTALDSDNQWHRFDVMRACATAALLRHQHDRAIDDLNTIWEHVTREQINEPGAFPIAADLIECLIATDQPARAHTVIRELDRLAQAQRHPWALTTVRRARALLALAGGGDLAAAAAESLAAAAEYQRLGLAFEHARTLLSLGVAARRRRRWGIARDALQAAATSFDQLDSPGWTQLAREELARVGGRRPRQPGALTASEQRVGELASAGLANKRSPRPFTSRSAPSRTTSHTRTPSSASALAPNWPCACSPPTPGHISWRRDG